MRLTALMISMVLLGSSGCASITRGTSQVFVIQSFPAGAKATVSTGQVCTTPCEIKLKRKFAFTVLLEMPGYKTLTAKVDSAKSAAGSSRMLGNMLFGGLMGAMIDMNSGALKDLAPNPLLVELAPLESVEDSVVLAPDGTPANTPDSADPAPTTETTSVATAPP